MSESLGDSPAFPYAKRHLQAFTSHLLLPARLIEEQETMMAADAVSSQSRRLRTLAGPPCRSGRLSYLLPC